MSQHTQDILFKLGVTAAAQRHDMHMQVISITITSFVIHRWTKEITGGDAVLQSCMKRKSVQTDELATAKITTSFS